MLSVLVALAAPAVAQAKELRATVGPGFTIVLIDESGTRVTHLDPGEHTIHVEDRSIEHNFRLSGPGVERATEIDAISSEVWTVTLVDGVYTYFCEPHSDELIGRFAVGSATLPTPRPPTTTKVTRLIATVGPGFTITLRTVSGARVRRVKPGAYAIVVRDRSRIHNFRLTGPGVRRATGVAFRGTVTWRVTLRAGTYRFRCDPHRTTLRGSFTVRT